MLGPEGAIGSTTAAGWCAKCGVVLFAITLPGSLSLRTATPVSAQDFEICRWNHLPINENFVATNFAHTEGGISVDPALRLENVTVDLDTWLLGYI